MTFESEFDFGDVSGIKVLNEDHATIGVDDVFTHLAKGEANASTPKEWMKTNGRTKRMSNPINFDTPQSPISPSSSATSIHSAVSDFPTSNYWHIPDKHSYLTSIAIQEDSKLCAIGSGASTDNLFIYEVYPDEVTHHQTITLPEIHSLKWASRDTQLGQMGNVLVSGHKNGVAHLTMLPDSTSTDGKAEILKRYNHTKHFSAEHRARSRRIKSLELTSPSWNCCTPSSLFTFCGDHIFLWEPNRSDVPLVMQKTHSTNTFGLCNSRDGVYALGRKRGVCIRDIRIRDRVNSGLKPPVENDESVSLVKWNPYDGGNQLAAVHDRRTIKIWDIRSKEPLSTYKRHADTISSIEWSTKSELVSASTDGTVRVWDVDNTESDVKPLDIPNKFSNGAHQERSTYNNYVRRQTLDLELEGFANDLLARTVPVNQSRQFVAMSLAQMGPAIGAITIDSGSCLGVHELCDINCDLGDSAMSQLSLNGSDYLSPL